MGDHTTETTAAAPPAPTTACCCCCPPAGSPRTPAGGSPDGSAPRTLQVLPHICRRGLQKRKLFQHQCPPLPVSPSWGHPQAGAGVTLGLGARRAQPLASAMTGQICLSWRGHWWGHWEAVPLSMAGLSFRLYPGWAPDPFLSLIFNFTAKAPGRSIWEEVFP